jgi:magnesium transporter
VRESKHATRTESEAPGAAALSSFLITAGGDHPTGIDRAELERRLAADEFFWLDLFRPTADELALLREVFGFHPLALEDTERFGQRPKIEDYDDFTFLVVYGATEDEDRLVEVHCFFAERCLVTVHRDDCPAFAALRAHYLKSGAPTETPIRLLHEVIDWLVDSFFPILTELDDELDRIEELIAREPDNSQLQAIFDMRRRLVTLRKVVLPQRDLLARLATGVAELPGMTAEDERYFRDVYDHQIRIFDLLESYRDLLAGAHDVYLSTVSNRINSVMKQLAVIATIFLPLTFVTGFFGQNFGWMVEHISSSWAFLALGIGSEVVALAVLVVMFKRRGWF